MAKLKPKTTRAWIVLSVSVLVIAAVAGLTYSAGGLTQVMNHLIKVDTIWLLLIIGAQSFAYWAYVIPYKHVFKLNYKEAVEHSFEGFHPFRPLGGLIYDLKTHKSSGSRALVYYLGICEYAVLVPAILAAAIYAFVNHLVPLPMSLPWIIGVPAGALLFAGLVINRQHFKISSKFHESADIILGAIKKQGWHNTILLFGGMMLYWLGEIFALWGALQLFGIHLEWFALLIAYATGYLVTRRSLPLGGAGVILITLAFSLHWVGATLSVALLAALAYQLSNLLMPVIYRQSYLKVR